MCHWTGANWRMVGALIRTLTSGLSSVRSWAGVRWSSTAFPATSPREFLATGWDLRLWVGNNCVDRAAESVAYSALPPAKAIQALGRQDQLAEAIAYRATLVLGHCMEVDPLRKAGSAQTSASAAPPRPCWASRSPRLAAGDSNGRDFALALRAGWWTGEVDLQSLRGTAWAQEPPDVAASALPWAASHDPCRLAPLWATGG